MSTGDPQLDEHLARRREMQQAAYELAAEGGAHFRCNSKECDGPAPTVVDEDGCCVYCGVDAEQVAEVAPGTKGTTK